MHYAGTKVSEIYETFTLSVPAAGEGENVFIKPLQH